MEIMSHSCKEGYLFLSLFKNRDTEVNNTIEIKPSSLSKNKAYKNT